MSTSELAGGRPIGMNCSAILVQCVTAFSAGAAVVAGVASASTASTTIAATNGVDLLMAASLHGGMVSLIGDSPFSDSPFSQTRGPSEV
jgi:hypothetical protein